VKSTSISWRCFFAWFLSDKPGKYLKDIDEAISTYQFFSKAPYADIFVMPVTYLGVAVTRLSELEAEKMKAMASMFLPMAGGTLMSALGGGKK